MNRLPIFLLVTALWIGILPSSGDAREKGCFGQGGLDCYCCIPKKAHPAGETFSLCPCPCSGSIPWPGESLSLDQDLIMALTVLEFNLVATGFIDTSNPVYHYYFGNPPQKPPPFLF